MRSSLIGLIVLLGLVLSRGTACAGSLRDDLDRAREDAGLPALATLRLEAGNISQHHAVGRRAANQPTPVAPDDRWHLGSCTKAMTATLLATLVAEGTLAWDDTLGHRLEDLPIDPGYQDVTLAELLRMRAGTPSNGPLFFYAPAERTGQLTGPLARKRYVWHLLQTPPNSWPDASPGRGTHHYSNASYVIAGHVAERVTGQTWEDLMKSRLFKPLGMASAGFGPPSASPDGTLPPLNPLGHTHDGKPVPPGPFADNAMLLGPAGTVHASLTDWAAFLQCHLDGPHLPPGQRDALGLTADHYRTLHDPGPLDLGTPQDPRGYAMGWGVLTRKWAGLNGQPGTALAHSGSNTLWYAVTWLAPERRLAALVVTNTAKPTAAPALDRTAYRLLTHPD